MTMSPILYPLNGDSNTPVTVTAAAAAAPVAASAAGRGALQELKPSAHGQVAMWAR